MSNERLMALFKLKKETTGVPNAAIIRRLIVLAINRLLPPERRKNYPVSPRATLNDAALYLKIKNIDIREDAAD